MRRALRFGVPVLLLSLIPSTSFAPDHDSPATSLAPVELVVPSKNSSVAILLRFSTGSGYLASHGQMAWDSHWDTAIDGSRAPGVSAGEPRASAATRRVEGAPAAATAEGYGPDLLGDRKSVV